MVRIVPSDVEEILDTELDGAELFAFIEDAHRIINERCASLTDDDEALAAVETYLAAHLATAKEPRVSRTSGAVTTVELETDPETYWRRAKMLDPTGQLGTPQTGYPVAST